MKSILEDHNEDKFQLFDEEAQTLFAELGILEKFRTVVTTTPINQFVSVVEHPTHFIAALHFAGQPDPGENGFLAVCYAKQKFSIEDYAQFVEQFVKDSTIIKIDGV